MAHSVKLQRVLLENFLPLYGSTGLKRIEIDRTSSTNNIILILGENGSGKTFLLTELSPFPNESVANRVLGFQKIIPETDGRKEIDILVDNTFLYHFEIIYPQKGSTKCYMKKENIITGEIVELNQNGNVSSYIELLEQELNLTQNYINIGYISDGITNFIQMKASERNKYISQWLPVITEYLESYATVSKNKNIIKKQIDMLTAELNKIVAFDYKNDLEYTNATISELEQKLTDTQRKLTEGEVYKTMLQSKMNTSYDIRDSIYAIKKSREELQIQYEQISTIISDISEFSEKGKKEKIAERIVSISTEIQTIAESITKLDKDLINIRSDIDELESKKSLQNEFSGTSLIETRELLEKLLKEQNDLRKIRENYLSSFPFYENTTITENEIDIIFKIIDEIRSLIKKMESIYMISTIKDKTYELTIDTKIKNIEQINSIIISLENEIEQLQRRTYVLNNNGLDDNIKDIINSVECSKECPLVKEIETYLNPSSELVILKNKIIELQIQIQKYNEEKQTLQVDIENHSLFLKYMEDLNHLLYIQRHIIGKLPENILSLFTNTTEEIISKIDTIDTIIKKFNEYISITNTLKLVSEKIEKIKNIESLLLMKEQISKNEQAIYTKYNTLREERNKLIEQKEYKEQQIKKLQLLYNNMENLDEQINQYNNAVELHNTKRIQSYMQSYIWYYYSHIKDILIKLKNEEINIKQLLSQQRVRKEEILHILSTRETLETKIEELKKQYELVSVLEKVWSPKIGYPALLIKEFLDDVKFHTNNDLDFIWDKHIQIKDFIMTNDEFSIPVIKENELEIQDAALCSDGERATLALAISLAIIEIHTKKSIYNILRLDEADAKLDDTRRKNYLSIILNRMKEIGIENSIIITHNNEFDAIPADVILLSPIDKYNVALSNKNIIFSV